MAKVQALAATVRKILRDADEDQFVDGDLHNYIYDAELAHAIYKPDEFTAIAPLACVAGSRQKIDSLALPFRFLSVKRNTNGPIVNRLSRDLAERWGIDIESQAPSKTIKGYMEDERDPNAFNTVPPASVGASLDVLYVKAPAEYGTVDANTETTLSDIYQPSIIEWVLYRCFSEDGESSPNFSRAGRHLQNFASMLGVKIEMDQALSPKNPRHES